MAARTSSGAETLSDASSSRVFSAEGYLVIDDPCSPEQVDAVAGEFDARFRDAFHPGPKHMQDGVLYATEKNLPGQATTGSESWTPGRSVMLRAASRSRRRFSPHSIGSSTGRTPRPFQTLNFPIGTQQPAHSDSMFFSASPPTYVRRMDRARGHGHRERAARVLPRQS